MAFSDNARQTVEGAVAFISSRVAGSPVEVTSRRPEPDRILFRLSRTS